MKVALDSIIIPFNSLLHGNHTCDSTDHFFSIEKYFCDIVDAISEADKVLPRSRPTMSKDYWDVGLTNSKKASFDAFCLWRDVGRPSSGPVHDLKVKTHFQYKGAIRKAKKQFDKNRCDRIHDNLLQGDNNRFWESWQDLHGKRSNNITRINGNIDDLDIANDFAASLKKIYDDANSDQAGLLSSKFELLYHNYFGTHKNDDLSPFFLSWDDMITIMSKLEPGKSTASFIKADHILNGCPQLTIHLHLLFNAIILHSYVPSDFLKGVISPIVKDLEGDLASLDNYRGITLSHVFAYLFEHAMLIKIDSFLTTDSLQFGYKKRHSTSHAIFTVKQCINYFTQHGSHVYSAFLDLRKDLIMLVTMGYF